MEARLTMLKNAFFATAALGAAFVLAQAPATAGPAALDMIQDDTSAMTMVQWYPSGTSGEPRPIPPVTVHGTGADEDAACAGAMAYAPQACRFDRIYTKSDCNCHDSGEVTACSVTVWCRRQ